MKTTDAKQLHGEIARYLAVVELFRREGREPIWAAEAAPVVAGGVGDMAPRIRRGGESQ